MTGQERKVKISELPASVTFKGLWTIGYQEGQDGRKTSVRVSLDEIQSAYEGVVKATRLANEASQKANTSATSAGQAAEAANTAAGKANTSAGKADEATAAANTAAGKAGTAAQNADKAREGLESIKAAAETATAAANKAANNANNKAQKAETAADNADTEAARAKEQADNPPKMGDNGNWWKWDEKSGKYVDTGILAKGGILYPTFTIEPETMELVMYYQDDIAADMFAIDKEGYLTFNPK